MRRTLAEGKWVSHDRHEKIMTGGGLEHLLNAGWCGEVYVYSLIEFSQQSHSNWYCYYLNFVEEETETERLHG